MRDGWKSRWGWRVSAIVLVGELLILGTGTLVTQAGERDDDRDHRNPFQQILHKLDKILDAIKGGGGQEGNHTLRWDTNHPSASRFTPAFPGAVLDKNTGLVWEQAPDALIHNWLGAIIACVEKNVGGTVGWRLPSVVELNSVRDLSLPAPFVPVSVFSGVQLAGYWSATAYVGSEPPSSAAWFVGFGNGVVSGITRSGTLRAWCVRGGMNADQY